MKVGVSWNLVRVLARVGSARSTIGAALDTSPARSPRRGAVGNTMRDREGPRYGARVIIRPAFLRVAMFSNYGWFARRRHASLALDTLVAAGAGAADRAGRRDRHHRARHELRDVPRHEVVVAASAMARALMLLLLLGRRC